jgi:hypothetical protein
MSRESRMFAGVLLVVLPSVMYGGITLLGMLMGNTPGYSDNPLAAKSLARRTCACRCLSCPLAGHASVRRGGDSLTILEMACPSWRTDRCHSNSRRLLLVGHFTDGHETEWLDQSRIHRRPISRCGRSESRSRSDSCRTGCRSMMLEMWRS